jgi:hypothetical protein
MVGEMLGMRPFSQNEKELNVVGSLGFEPRLPTPQAGILDQNARIFLRIPSKRILIS